MKLNPEIKANPFSRASLMVWLMSQPAEESYPALRPDGCMLFQWLQSIDPEAWWIPSPRLHNSFRYVVKGAVVDLVHFRDIAVEGETTFGAALNRAVERGGKL